VTARRRWLVAFALAILAAVVAAAGWAFYVATSTAGSSGRARAAFLPTGKQPAVSVSGRDVTVSWAQDSVAALGGLLGAQAHGGYTITRYAESAPSTPITAGANCSGTQSGSTDPLTCTEDDLPTGRWKYTATPSYYNWVGGESSQSAHAIIAPAAPSSVTLVNGGGVGGAYINAANKTSLTIDVTLPATSLSSDTVNLSLGDGVHSPVTSSKPATAGAGSVSFTGVNASSLSDGSIAISSTSSSSYGDPSSATQITRTKDTVAPIVNITASRIPDSNGWYNHAVTFSASTSTDTGGSGIQSCDSDVAYSTPDTASGSQSFTCTDKAGNSASDTITFKYDGTKPTDALALGASPSHAFLSGTTLYYKGDTAGSFSVVDTVSDTTSGPASATFPALNTLGWTGAGGVISTPSGGPYSSSYSWTAAQSLNPSNLNVASLDTAGNSSVGASWTIVKDISAPTGTVSASGTSNTVSLTSGAVTDTGSGAVSVAYYRCTSSCTGTPLSAPANWTLIGSSTSPTTWPVSWDSTGMANGSYTIKTVLTDNVGNQGVSSNSATVAVSNNLQPTAITIANGTGTAGVAEQGDVITITWNHAINLATVCSSWSTASQSVTGVTIDMSAGNGSHTNDLTFSGGTVGASACSGGIKLGTIPSDSHGYIPNNATNDWTNSSVTWNASANQLVITLGAGTPSAVRPTSGSVASSNFTYQPAVTIALAGNPSITATGSATTGSVKNF
jgi:hypothetical protein